MAETDTTTKDKKLTPEQKKRRAKRYRKTIRSTRQDTREMVNSTSQADRLTTRLLSLNSQINALKDLEGGGIKDSKVLQNNLDKLQNNLTNVGDKLKLRDTSQSEAIKAGQKNLITGAVTDPQSLVPVADVEKINKTPGQFIKKTAGESKKISNQPNASTVDAIATVKPPEAKKATKVTAAESADKVARATKDMEAETGTVSPDAIMDPAQGTVSDNAVADAATFDPANQQLVDAGERTVSDNELVDAATDYEDININVDEAQKGTVGTAQGQVQDNELVDAATINEQDMAQATAVTADELTPAAKAKAVIAEKFTVDDGTLAEFKEGSIEAQDTVQGQLSSLMRDFEGGAVPGWAAGALRAANDAMSARGLGGSSIAAATIVQAAMESAIPIAVEDANAFREMKLNNLNRQTQVSLSNAMAQQGLTLANLDNEQKVALQNALAEGNLQSQNLSAQNSAVLANAQIKASLQGKNLDNMQQAGIVNAARWAEMNNLNLNNRQQSLIQESVLNNSVDLANLSTRTQQAVAEAQIKAALEGKVLDNRQQTAVINADKFASANDMTFTAEQNAALHNSELMKTIGLANLSAKNAAVLQNAATYANMDMANLDNRQQALVENSKAFLQMDLTNLNNKQQTAMFKQQSVIQSLFSDQAAKNVAKNLNMTEGNSMKKFYSELRTSVKTMNAAQKNAIRQFNNGEINNMKQFKAEMENTRRMFNASNKLAIATSNATWRRDAATIDTQAKNLAIMESTKASYAITGEALNNYWQKERDLMSFAFQGSENQADRDLELFLGEKTFDEYDKQRDEREDEGKGALLGYVTRKAVDSVFSGDLW